ncbi:orotidine 5'-phosphate decarboxylase [Polynucleobacter sp. SHI8]|uniref:orotidine-5'-phosphate decarboxylase n=1 Tax=unclassified Polynucleobacter TaxID=2640945 RepID=UPI00248FB084|nr:MULTISPECIES: orotidine-5'-phosphate decarboxylase [unclassified Polynucleobacter]BDW10152.1 orotidine 5'-phosphate decarboxylase [Polynucleobacter sp. SHI2]BDW12598.1 orotidine 5'-phosphate decarboxylase [Polynucleobacter sp. SHI8]
MNDQANYPAKSSVNGFVQKYQRRVESHNTMLCVGLDPDISKLPATIGGQGGAIYSFCREIVDATADLVCAYKPQIAYFASARAEDQLEQLIDYIHQNYPDIPVILDAKRGDIGSTANHYAAEAFDRYQADAVTANPYMGFDSIEPYLAYQDRGVFILCRTSNPGGSDLQFLELNHGQAPQKLFEKVAQLAANEWNQSGQIGLVVGATFPAEIETVRNIVGDAMPLLIPGIGAQGGDTIATVKAGHNTNLLINSSRAILYASSDQDFAQAARKVAMQTRDAIRAV